MWFNQKEIEWYLPISVEFSMALLRDSVGGIVGSAAIVRDVTELNARAINKY